MAETKKTLPGPSAPGKTAIAKATAEPAEKGAATSRGTSGLKPLIISLVVLVVLAAGAFGWLRLIERKRLESDLSRNRGNLLRLQEQVTGIQAAATRIRDENQQTVKQLSELIVSVAIPMKINDKISVQSSGQRRRWKTSDVYEESTCEVSFHQKEGYDFKDLCNFLRYIERQNPKVQIKAINFGSRDDDVGKDLWRPLSMTVRVFAPKVSRR